MQPATLASRSLTLSQAAISGSVFAPFATGTPTRRHKAASQIRYATFQIMDIALGQDNRTQSITSRLWLRSLRANAARAQDFYGSLKPNFNSYLDRRRLLSPPTLPALQGTALLQAWKLENLR